VCWMDDCGGAARRPAVETFAQRVDPRLGAQLTAEGPRDPEARARCSDRARSAERTSRDPDPKFLFPNRMRTPKSTMDNGFGLFGAREFKDDKEQLEATVRGMFLIKQGHLLDCL